MSSVITNGLDLLMHHQLRMWADYIKETAAKLVAGMILTMIWF